MSTPRPEYGSLMARAALATLLTIALTMSLTAPAVAVDDAIVVTGDNQANWLFNRDVRTMSPYEFTTDESSIGYGSLYVSPIQNDANEDSPAAWDKFIAEHFLDIPTADLQSISYDFLIEALGPQDANEFYLNIYTFLPDTEEEFYDCRFDYVPQTGSTAVFTTVTVNAEDTPTDSRAKSSECGATLAEMPEGSTLSFFSLSVGDTTLNDTGVAGYYDNVIVRTDEVKTYDFEAMPQDKDACKKGGFADYGFVNQGQCISSIQANENARK